MAYTKIHAITATVSKAVDYICNPVKNHPNKAYHLIQSFLPGEVTYKEAHQIGVELADRLLEGKYSYVVSTHIDKGHVHNHVIFCAADNVNHQKYHDCKKTYYNIRSLSDDLCREHELSIITPGEKGAKLTRNGRLARLRMERAVKIRH